jgi:predicted enzyme related to lactoylglutathione lyase
LWTSDVDGSRQFYSELFGWEAQEPSPEFGGYFMFTRDGVPVAGGMGDMGEARADNTWKVYLATDDMARTLQSAEAEGGQVLLPAMPVADLGVQAVVLDPTGVPLGVWEPKAFPGFTVLNEAGAPSWFELFSSQYERALAFYRSTFRWETKVIADSDAFRYSVLAPGGGDELAGVMDATAFLPEGVPGQWAIYWDVDDVAATAAKVTALGGRVVQEPEQSPYGTMATVADPAGAVFKLRMPPVA